MRYQIHIALLFAVFALQAQAFWHAAEHGFEAHEHHGESCELTLFCQQFSATDVPAQLSLAVPDYTIHTVPPHGTTALYRTTYPTSSPRAPPLFS